MPIDDISHGNGKEKLSRYIIAGILIIIPLIVYLALPTYNKVNPEMAGMPFFYWYQTVWLAISAVLFGLAAYILDRTLRGDSQ
ncbi:MAG: DUF3311 domain-containing protein [Thermoplasmata archaeon]